jgi:hypothetical protein
MASIEGGRAAGLGEEEATTRQVVQEYYGRVLNNTSDLKTSACVAAGKPPLHIRNALRLVRLRMPGLHFAQHVGLTPCGGMWLLTGPERGRRSVLWLWEPDTARHRRTVCPRPWLWFWP